MRNKRACQISVPHSQPDQSFATNYGIFVPCSSQQSLPDYGTIDIRHGNQHGRPIAVVDIRILHQRDDLREIVIRQIASG